MGFIPLPLPHPSLPVLQGFGQMGYTDISSILQVSNGPGYLQYPVEGPG
jgi:hypothetical protein